MQAPHATLLRVNMLNRLDFRLCDKKRLSGRIQDISVFVLIEYTLLGKLVSAQPQEYLFSDNREDSSGAESKRKK